MTTTYVPPQAPGPALSAQAITTPATFPKPTSRIYVGTTGNVTALLANDTVAVTFTAVPAGTLLPIAAVQVTTIGANSLALF